MMQQEIRMRAAAAASWQQEAARSGQV